MRHKMNVARRIARKQHASWQTRFLDLAVLFNCSTLRSLVCDESMTVRLHPHVGVPREHGARDVASDAHDHLVTGARLGDLLPPEFAPF
jgi:hypothetical protein